MPPIWKAPRQSAAAPASARSSGSIRAKSRRAACRWCSTARIAGSLIGHLANAVNGASIARKTSFLREKLGEQIFAPGIDIIDDPLRKRGLRSRPFDAEGVATSARKVVEGGVLKTWFLDSATARELGLQTTGHAYRGVSSPPSPGPSNLHLVPGAKSPEALIAEIADGFYVTDLIGVRASIW